MLKNLLPTFRVDIEHDRSTLNVQQELVLREQFYSLKYIDGANKALDDKAMSLLQAASIIFALIGTLRFPALFLGDTPIGVKILVGVGFAFFGWMVFEIIRAWNPTYQPTVGTQSWDEIYYDYIYKSRGGAFSQALSNILDVYADLRSVNIYKAARVKWAARLFVAQIATLLILALFS